MEKQRHISSPEFKEEIEDPREDDLIEMPREVENYLNLALQENLPEPVRRDIEQAVHEFERTVAAQIFEIRIETVLTEKGPRTIIRVYVPKYKNSGFLPQNEKRKKWEQWKDENHPAYQRNIVAGDQLGRALHFRQPIPQPIELPHVRIGMGTMYQFADKHTGMRQVAVRVNTDPNNIYRGWGNPMSGLVKIVRRNNPPIQFRNASTDEIILASERDGIVRPFYDEKFLQSGNHAAYKRKALMVEGSDPEQALIQRPEKTQFIPDRYDTGVDVIFDYSDFGSDRLCKMQNVNVVLTPQGTLEIQTIVNTEQPDLLLDPEFGSDIVVISTEAVADWSYKWLKRQNPTLDLTSVIDGRTGRPTTDTTKIQSYQQNFRASPPLWAPFGQILGRKNRGQ